MTRVVLDRLTVAYRGGPPVVDDLSLEVAPGSLLALLGPSGCGKTTTLKVLAGLLDASGGDVRFDDRSVLPLRAEARPVAMVFQKPLLFPHLTVGQNVAFGLRARGVRGAAARSRVAEMLDLVRLPGYEDRRPGELSGGQEQRVSLARALVVEPQVLLLDEPLSQLDAGLRVEMRELVRRVQREVGVTTLFVTHDQEEAAVVADEVGLMLDGRLQQVGAPRDLYERPASLAVARFFGTANTVAGTVAGGTWLGPLGPLPVSAPDGPGVLVVRQEALRLAAEGIPAVVRAVTYTGTASRVDLDAGGTALVAVVPPTARVAVGDRVHVVVPPEHCSVVAPQSERLRNRSR